MTKKNVLRTKRLMLYALFLIYLAVFGWLIMRSTLAKTSGLDVRLVLGLFLLRVAVGVAYGYIYSSPALQPHSDSWQIFFESITEYKQLLADPPDFFRHWFANPDQLSYSNLFGSSDSYWNDLKDKVLVKFQAVMNLLSGGRYYVNVVIYSFLTFPASLLLFRWVQRLFPVSKMVHVVTVFLLPSFLFYAAGMYKDGYIFLFVVVAMERMQRDRLRWQDMLLVAVSLSCLFLLRNYVALLLAPALLAWAVAKRMKAGRWMPYAVLYGLGAMVVLLGERLHASLNFPAYLAAKQHDFLALPAHTKLRVPLLEGTPSGLAEYLPFALHTGFFSPTAFQWFGWTYLPFALELLALVVLLAICVYRRPVLTGPQRLFLAAVLAFTFSCWLFLGYVVPIVGAIVRYRIICLPLLVSCLAGIAFKESRSN